MKKLIIALILTLPILVKAQTSGPFNYKIEDRYLYYRDVVKVDTSFTINDLYKDAKLFITKLALTNTDVTYDNATEGTVIVDIEEPATYSTQTGIGSDPMTLKYTFKIEMKKGRYRYTIDNIFITFMDSDNKNIVHPLYDVDKDKGGGLLGLGRSRRVLKAMDALFLRKIEMLYNTMKKRSDDF